MTDATDTTRGTRDAPGEPAPGDAPPRSRRTLWAVLAALAVAAVTAFLAIGLMNQNVDQSIDDALEKGERPPAPAFTLPLLAPGGPLTGAEGTPVSLSDLRGRVVVLNMWASWCDPCKNEVPYLQAMADRLAPKGVVVLGVDVQDQTVDAREFIKANGITFPSVRDGNDDVKNAYAATGVPETFVIDRQGRIALKWRNEMRAEQAQAIEDTAARLAAEPAKAGS